MAIKLKDSFQSLKQKTDTAVQEWLTAKADNLVEAGELLMKKAVAEGEYTDRTGNLRSSVGYLVTVNGQVYKEGFTDGEGGTIAREKALFHAGNRIGLNLIVIAGMDYATYVESKGFNVLTSAELIAEDLLNEILRRDEKNGI